MIIVQTWEVEEGAEMMIAQTCVGVGQVQEVCVVMMNMMCCLVQGHMTLGGNLVQL